MAIMPRPRYRRGCRRRLLRADFTGDPVCGGWVSTEPCTREARRYSGAGPGVPASLRGRWRSALRGAWVSLVSRAGMACSSSVPLTEVRRMEGSRKNRARGEAPPPLAARATRETSFVSSEGACKRLAPSSSALPSLFVGTPPFLTPGTRLPTVHSTHMKEHQAVRKTINSPVLTHNLAISVGLNG